MNICHVAFSTIALILLLSPSTQAQTPTASRANVVGKGLVCLSEDIEPLNLAPGQIVELQATTIFKDGGVIRGKHTFPREWRIVERSKPYGALIMLVEPVVLSAAKKCANAKFEMFMNVEKSPSEARSSESRIFFMSDILDYRIPDKKPAIEVNDLVADLRVIAILHSDVVGGRKILVTAPSPRDAATECSLEVTKLAVHMGIGLGGRSSRAVTLLGTPFEDATYGCPDGYGHARYGSIFVAWSGRARPTTPEKTFVAKAAEFFVGTTRAEVIEEIEKCITDALKPAAEELAERNFRGARIDCRAFHRDGGAGSVEVYRRYGPSPIRPEPTGDQVAAMIKRSRP